MQISAFVDKGGRNSARALLTVNLMLSELGYSLREHNKMLAKQTLVEGDFGHYFWIGFRPVIWDDIVNF
jgi:hypothetical protein